MIKRLLFEALKLASFILINFRKQLKGKKQNLTFAEKIRHISHIEQMFRKYCPFQDIHLVGFQSCSKIFDSQS
jgi:hypothetical protein